jgi:hypothetical protein
MEAAMSRSRLNVTMIPILFGAALALASCAAVATDYPEPGYYDGYYNPSVVGAWGFDDDWGWRGGFHHGPGGHGGRGHAGHGFAHAGGFGGHGGGRGR